MVVTLINANPVWEAALSKFSWRTVRMGYQ